MDQGNNGGFPKYQFSVFVKNGMDGQYVIRANDFDEFKAMKAQLDELLPTAAQPALKLHTEEPPSPEDDGPAAPSTLGQVMSGRTCPECGSPTTFKEGVSKAGKPYKGYFCTGPDKLEHKPQWVK